MVQCRPWQNAYAGIAQSVEQLIRNQQVVSSSLISSSKERKVKGSFVLFFAEKRRGKCGSLFTFLPGCAMVDTGKCAQETEKFSCAQQITHKQQIKIKGDKTRWKTKSWLKPLQDTYT